MSTNNFYSKSKGTRTQKFSVYHSQFILVVLLYGKSTKDIDIFTKNAQNQTDLISVDKVVYVDVC